MLTVFEAMLEINKRERFAIQRRAELEGDECLSGRRDCGIQGQDR